MRVKPRVRLDKTSCKNHKTTDFKGFGCCKEAEKWTRSDMNVKCKVRMGKGLEALKTSDSNGFRGSIYMCNVLRRL